MVGQKTFLFVFFLYISLFCCDLAAIGADHTLMLSPKIGIGNVDVSELIQKASRTIKTEKNKFYTYKGNDAGLIDFAKKIKPEIDISDREFLRLGGHGIKYRINDSFNFKIGTSFWEEDPIIYQAYSNVYNPYEMQYSTMLLAKYINIKPGMRVLDLGTGSGVFAIWAAQQGAKVIATDINPHAIACAYDNAKSNNVENNIEFRLGNGLDAVLSSETFDIIAWIELPFHNKNETLQSLNVGDANYNMQTKMMSCIRNHLSENGNMYFVADDNWADWIGRWTLEYGLKISSPQYIDRHGRISYYQLSKNSSADTVEPLSIQFLADLYLLLIKNPQLMPEELIHKKLTYFSKPAPLILAYALASLDGNRQLMPSFEQQLSVLPEHLQEKTINDIFLNAPSIMPGLDKWILSNIEEIIKGLDQEKLKTMFIQAARKHKITSERPADKFFDFALTPGIPDIPIGLSQSSI
jgi:SAM-dependent methyltransferase